MPRPGRTASALTALVSSIVVLALAGCSETRELRAGSTTVGPAPTSLAADVTPTTAPTDVARVVDRLASVQVAGLTLGDAFNREFLAVQFRAVGLDAAESTCAVEQVAAAGEDFAQRPVGEVMTARSVTPQVLTSCVAMDRLMSLTTSGVRPDFSKVPADLLRSVLTELVAAGYATGGLAPDEASCVAAAVLGGTDDAEVIGLLGQADLSAPGVADALTGCLTPERISELAG